MPGECTSMLTWTADAAAALAAFHHVDLLPGPTARCVSLFPEAFLASLVTGGLAVACLAWHATASPLRVTG
jgi:hypothetical protein